MIANRITMIDNLCTLFQVDKVSFRTRGSPNLHSLVGCRVSELAGSSRASFTVLFGCWGSDGLATCEAMSNSASCQPSCSLANPTEECAMSGFRGASEALYPAL